VFFTSDSSWLCDDKSNTDTSIPTVFPKNAVELGEPATLLPWKSSIGFGYAGPRGTLIPVKMLPGKMTVKIAEMPKLDISKIRFRLEKTNGEKHTLELSVTPGSDKWKKDETLTIEYPFPHVEGGGFKLYVDDCFVAVKGNAPIASVPARKEKIPSLKQARLRQGNGRPYLEFGKDKLNGTFWLVPASANHEPELDISRTTGFTNQRINSGFVSFWMGENKYDFTNFDYAVDRMLSFMPDAIFSLIFEVDMPEWWCQAHPEEASAHYGGNPRAHLEREKQGLASKRWIRDAEAPLKALVEHIKQRSYADRIWGISFASGCNWEWFWANKDAKFRRSWCGYSPADLATFRGYMKEKYGTDTALAKAWNMPGLTFETMQFPDWNRYGEGSVGMLFDTSKDQQIIDWLEFRNRALAEALDGLGSIIKKATDGKWMVGAYYGYSVQLADNPTNPLPMSGHNGFFEAAKSPNVDFVHGPSSYEKRKTGLAETTMQNWSTWLLHGKMIYVEQDTRTGYFDIENRDNKIYCGAPNTAFESVGQLNRGFGMELATGVFNYWFDIAAGAFYEKAMSDICMEQRVVRDNLPAVKGTTPIETAIVLDRDSFYYTKTPVQDGLFSSAMRILLNFNKLAIPYRNMTVQDLLDKTITVPSHKLYIMLPTLILDKEQRNALMERFQREKATVVWLYGPGAFYPLNGPSAENCADFLGIKVKMSLEKYRPEMTCGPEYGNIKCSNFRASAPWFLPEAGFDAVVGADAKGQPLMVRKKIGAATHYFTSLMNLPEELYARIMEGSGVHRYMDTIDDQCWIGNDVFFLYACTSGKKCPKLPSGRRARAIIGPFKGVLKSGEGFEATAGMTYGFVLE
ncbi:MAG: beta-galactosidase, partial [Victivallales bacterium]|nr:beta-galactosidase [Victivallales bacterium]